MKQKRAPGGGRKKKLTPCPYCRKEFGAREFREHFGKCEKRDIKRLDEFMLGMEEK